MSKPWLAQEGIGQKLQRYYTEIKKCTHALCFLTKRYHGNREFDILFRKILESGSAGYFGLEDL